jgi:uncharacterized membrane protein YkvA (DUF1232 family)
MTQRATPLSSQFEWSWQLLQFLRHLPNFARLYWRLVRDPRVSFWPKAMLVLAIGYVIMPFDIIPDLAPLLGQIDDLVLLIAACRLFIQWCPPAVVREHVRAIGSDPTGWAPR